MPNQLTVLYENKPCYNIIFKDNLSEVVENIMEIKPDTSCKICIFSDDLVGKHYLNDLKEALSNKYNQVITYTIPNGENSKTLANIEKLYRELIENHFDRKDLLIALGGGVVGDMTGFGAATYLRGIDFVQVPTTLLSQVDSSIGGKTGVDFLHYKNMVGAFYMPRLVYIAPTTLLTLSDAQFASGMGEVIKHGLIRDLSYFDWMEAHADAILAKDLPTLESLIYTSCDIKRQVVQEDPKEQGIRAHLNFGHTIGHAIEKLSDFRLLHGQCVALGMCAAGYISKERGLISTEDYQRILRVIDRFGLPTKLTLSMDAAAIVQATKSDKKMEGDHVKFILLDGLGCAKIYKDVTDDEMLRAIASLQE